MRRERRIRKNAIDGQSIDKRNLIVETNLIVREDNRIPGDGRARYKVLQVIEIDELILVAILLELGKGRIARREDAWTCWLNA